MSVSWSEDDVKAYERKARNLRGAATDGSTDDKAAGTIAPETMVRPVKSAASPSISKKKCPTQLERDFEAYLKNGINPELDTLLVQAMTLRLGPTTTYRPDFVMVSHRMGGVELSAYETKGPHRFRRAGIEKLKWAAKTYAWIAFYLVTRENRSSAWKIEKVEA